MSTRITTPRRVAAVVAVAGLAVAAAAVGTPATAVDDGPTKDRPCFIVQPRWNTSLDGPAPSCPTPSWRHAQAERGGGDVATLADCLDPGRRPPVRTCPYPIKSGDQFSHHVTFTR